ncbi:MAG: SusC/RagA family TonB-linked outer membrane protein, partial [Pseudobacter sp.]
IPVINLGLSNRVDIGNFYVYCMINYYGNFRVRVPVPSATDTRPLKGAGNYWKKPGDEMNPDILPDISNSSSIQYYFTLATTDRYTVNGSYLTLGDLTAAYILRDSKWLKNSGIGNVEIKVQASNIYTVGFNSYNYSLATGNFAKRYLTPTYNAAISVNF